MTYNMSGGVRGQFIIINNQTFRKGPNREGGEDAIKLMQTFQKLGFDVKQRSDLTVRQMLQEMKEVAGDASHSESNCFGVAVLTHRNKYDFWGTDTVRGRPALNLFQFIKPIRQCKALAGKPKLFFIQSGSGFTGDKEQPSGGDTVDAGYSNSKCTTVPQMADFLFAFSCTPFENSIIYGKTSNEVRFTQTLCRMLNEFSDKLSLLKILTRVNAASGSSCGAVCAAGTTKTLDSNNELRQSCFISTLRKELFLTENPKPADAGIERYLMDPTKRGAFIVINNYKFQTHTGFGERKGADMDEKNLTESLQALKFEVDLHTNLTQLDMLILMQTAAKRDYTNQDCFAMFVLSHGVEGSVAGTDGMVVMEDFVRPLKNCASLAGKPKLFFFQACQGDELDSGNEMEADDGTEIVSMGADDTEEKISLDADMLYAYATPPTFYAWRNTANGSWFVQALCELFRQSRDGATDLVTLLTQCNDKVAQMVSDCPSNEVYNKKKEAPCVLSMLTKELYL